MRPGAPVADCARGGTVADVNVNDDPPRRVGNYRIHRRLDGPRTLGRMEVSGMLIVQIVATTISLVAAGFSVGLVVRGYLEK